MTETGAGNRMSARANSDPAHPLARYAAFRLRIDLHPASRIHTFAWAAAYERQGPFHELTAAELDELRAAGVKIPDVPPSRVVARNPW